MKPMTERDEKGRTTHERLSDRDERWYDYDAAGHVTHVRLTTRPRALSRRALSTLNQKDLK